MIKTNKTYEDKKREELYEEILVLEHTLENIIRDIIIANDITKIFSDIKFARDEIAPNIEQYKENLFNTYVLYSLKNKEYVEYVRDNKEKFIATIDSSNECGKDFYSIALSAYRKMKC